MGIVSNGPEIQLFKRFKQKWASMATEDFLPINNIPSRSVEIIEFCLNQLESEQPRDDYRELLELTLIALRRNPPRGIRFSRPGACHRARWMAKIIYAIKIYLFRCQFKLTSRELDGIERFVTFVVTLYIPYWFTTPFAASAPSNDLKFLQDLVTYDDSSISSAAANAFSRHLWYLSEELIGLSFFDTSHDSATKRKMLAALQKEGSQKPEKKKSLQLNEVTICAMTIPDFITCNTRRFFTSIGSSGEFLNVDPSTWNTNVNFMEALQRAKSLKVTNDFAERGVALMQNYIPFLTKDEEQRQFIFQVIEDHRRRFPDARKVTVTRDI